MNREDLYEKLELARLPKESINEFLFALLGKSDFTENFKNKIYKETEGNPLFVIELVKFLVDEEIIQNIAGTWKLAKELKDGTIPSKVFNVISRRLNRVEMQDRKVLDFASIIGEAFDTTLLAATLAMNKVQLLERLRYLEQTHRLIHPQNGNFKFDHAKIKEVLYSEIPEELGREYHLEIANTLETLNKDNLDEVIVDLAFHYYRSRNKDKALFYLIKAAEKAKKDYSNEEAIKFYNYALELEENPKERIRILEDLGAIYDLIGQFDKSIECFKIPLGMTEDRKKRAELTVKLSGVLEKGRMFDEAMKICNEALDTVKGEECKEEALALHNIGHLYFSMGEYDRAFENLEKSIKIFEKIEDPQGIARSSTTLGTIYNWRGEFDLSIEYLEKSLEMFEKIGYLQGIAATHAALSKTCEMKGEFTKSLDHSKLGLRIYEKIGDQRGCLTCLSDIGEHLIGMGHFREAFGYLDKCLSLSNKIDDKDFVSIYFNSIALWHVIDGKYEKVIDNYKRSKAIADKIGSPLASSSAIYLLGMAYFYKGELDTALDYFIQSKKIMEKLGIPWIIGASHAYLGRTYYETGEYNKAILNLEKSLDILEGMGAKWGICNACNGLAKTYFRKGNLHKAWELSNRAHEISGNIGTKWQLAESARNLGMVYREQKKWEKSEKHFQESIETFDEIEMNPELVESHFEFGLMWKAQGDYSKAKEHLNKALDIYGKLRWEEKKEKVKVELEAL
ncbi:MAG: tetratricopeptide repeat protein [Thermoplasmata archaeon]|nr:MAG: tetratricopeptide repeat protein [Thermoplasmata archaeon]